MSNRAFLCGVEAHAIYPSFEAERRFGRAFDPARDTMLECSGCLPLAWLLLFHEDDMREEVFVTQDGDVDVVAPVVAREVGCTRLEARAEWVAGLFRAQGDLRPHFRALAALVRTYPQTYVTMEIQEIEHLYADQDELLDLLLAAWDGIDTRDPEVLDVLVEITTLVRDVRVPPIGHVAAASREEGFNFFRVLGGGWEVEAPWDADH